MKKLIAILLIIVLIGSLAACGVGDSSAEETVTVSEAQNEYVLSDEVDADTIIDGVMTDISAKNPILKRTTASWLDTCVLYEVNIRQYTEEGTFKAFESHLQRLKDMGINTLWLMPIHPISETGRKGTLGSYYAVSDYRGVNPEFGTEEEFRHLVDTAHDMGFKVILDWVANHTGWDNAWITEHDDWYVHDKNGEIESPYDWTDTAELDYDNYEMRAEMISSMQYWVEDFGIDGFRCDHAIGVPAPFWNAAVYKLKSINSEILMLAESSATESLTTYAFDSCYNDNLYGQCAMVRSGVATSSIRDGLAVDSKFVEGSFPMNYLDNHDKNSYTDAAEAVFRNAYPSMLTLSFLAPGMPMLYSSDEEGYDHPIEFFEKDTIVWDDNPKYADLITELSKIKTENAALSATNTDLSIIEGDHSDLFVFTRTLGDNTVIYVSNLFYEPIKGVSVDLGLDELTCALHYDGETLSADNTTMTADDFKNKDYEPYEFYVLIK